MKRRYPKPDTSHTGPRSALWVRCAACKHRWICLYLPMEAGNAARVMEGHSTCPNCASGPAFFDGQDAPLHICKQPGFDPALHHCLGCSP